MKKIKELFDNANPVEDHVLVLGIEDGWINANDESLTEYRKAKQRMDMFEDWAAMFRYFWKFSCWLKEDNDSDV